MGKQKRILVTGGGGYIGTHVVEQLLRRNNKVRIYDQLVFGRKLLADLEENPSLEVIKGEISDLYKLSLALKDVDEVVHLAGLVGDPACDIDKDFTIHMNVVSTRIIKELAKAFAIKRFIFASSCSVYGTSEALVDETSRLHPVSLYAKTKIDSERELLSDGSGDFHPVILRFATVFGHSRRPRFDLVANFFAAQAYYDGLMTVTGSSQWRPFIHVSDIARAIAKVTEAPSKLVDRQIYNVGDNRLNYTIGDLVNLIAKTIKKNIKGNNIEIKINDDLDDIRNYKVAFNKIRQNLGFKAKVNLKDGIYEIFENFRRGTYKKHYRDPMYSNLEMTKLMDREYRSHTPKRKIQPPLSLA